jgi:UDP-GlcNAc:undecaprenyl-phosphate GlcNAc-1-phosphate transferase
MFLGFVLAVTAVRGSQKGPTAVAILVPLLVLGLPLLDTGLAVLRRLYRLGRHGSASGAGRLVYIVCNIRQVFLPDRAHIHHRLLDLGFSHRRAVLTLYGAGTMFAGSAFALVLFNSPWIAALLLAFLGSLVALFYLVLYLRIRSGVGPPLDGPSERPLDGLAAAPRTGTSAH